MNPVIEHIEKTLFSNTSNEALHFRLSGVNVSLANSIRRTILSDIPILVFKTTPYEKNKANIIANTSRLNNEIIKQRLSCIPIHVKDIDEFPLKNLQMEVKVENITDSIMFVTTEDFEIRDLVSGKFIPKDKTREIFPPDDFTGQFIDFVRLRPKISDELPGEKIHITSEFSIGTAKDDGTFNVVSTCSYGFTLDEEKIDTEAVKLSQKYKDEGMKKEDIDFEIKNWRLLDALRIVKPDSFDFAVQTIGIYENVELLQKACEILIDKMNKIDGFIDRDEIRITDSLNTMENCFDIILENEDYTIGKVLEYMLYKTYFEETKEMTYCGFKKMHPHDNYSIIRVAYTKSVSKSNVKQNLKACISAIVQVYQRIHKSVVGLVKLK
jgi:DNA-directed RNA polymerase subunit L